MHRGYIKLYRKSVDHPLFTKPLVWHFWQYCLLRANHKDRETAFNNKPIVMKRGSFMMSLRNASRDTGLSVQNIRSAIKTLENFKMVEKSTQQLTQQATILTVCKYRCYQQRKEEANTASNTGLTQSQHSSNTVLTTDKNVKNLKNVENVEEDSDGDLKASLEKLSEKPISDYGQATKVPFDQMKTALNMSDHEIQAVYGVCSEPERLTEAVQCAVELDTYLREKKQTAIENPGNYIQIAYKDGKMSKKTRFEKGGGTKRSDLKSKEEVIEILKQAVDKPSESEMLEFIKKEDFEVWKIVKSDKPFLFKNKEREFNFIVEKYLR